MIYPQSFEQKLGMDEIRSLLKNHCLSSLGKQRVDEMNFLTHPEQILECHRQTGELALILQTDDNFPDQGYYDLRETLQRIRIEGMTVEIEELLPLKRSLQAISLLVAFLSTTEENHPEVPRYPALYRLCNNTLTFPQIVAAIEHILDKFGHIKDTASPELARIRHELAATEGSVSRILQRILKNAQAEGTVAADAAPTIRDGRLVLPVAPALKRKISGIIHDESATGKTVFIEPQEAVEANNRIRELEGEEHREILRILQNFSSEVRPHITSMLQSYEFLADIEYVRARVHFANEMQAFTTPNPQMAKEPLIDWTLAVHPLLQKALARHGKKVVPLEIALDKKQRILIISGPNAGGKSICLKTVGLVQYMWQCGLPVTVGIHSRFGIFRSIMIDIGDEQSIEDELSTYSGHLLNMKTMMRQAEKNTLLLIDEFGGGTEPQIGGAIAEAVLKRFVEQKAFGIITTHYQNLKLFADATPGVVNGAMLYDRHLMTALFQLQIGNPGSSFAIEIARKIGIPEEVIADASDIVGRDYIDADKWLQDIVRDKRYWESKRQNIHQREKQMDQTIIRYETEMQQLQHERREIIRKAKEEAEQLIQAANARIESTIREIREAQAEKELTKSIRQQLKDFQEEGLNDIDDHVDADYIDRKMQQIEARHQRQQERKEKKLKENRRKDENGQQSVANSNSSSTSTTDTPKVLSTGDTVRIRGQKAIGTIEHLDGKNAIVTFGMMRTTVKISQLEHAEKPKVKETAPGISFVSKETQASMREKSLHFQQDIDIRGMRGDEALQAVTLFIDDAIQVGVAQVRILHGTGTGILKTLIRQYLQTVPGIRNFRDEHVQFGGAGITVVEFI